MNLREVIRALENIRTEQYPEGILIADDIGVHQYCDILSNCPKAVLLRRLISDIGISLDELIEGFTNSQSPPPPLIDTEEHFPEISGKAKLYFADTFIEVDISDFMKKEFQRATKRKVNDLIEREQLLVRTGNKLYRTYLDAIDRVQQTKALPQLEYSAHELIMYNCLITKSGSAYCFILPLKYEPRWIYTNGNRYELDAADAAEIARNVYLVIPVSIDFKILRPYIIDKEGHKFQHYHGNSGDCWGQMKLPSVWDRRLKSLADLTYQLQAALATINYDSIMVRRPGGLIPIETLMERSKLLGREGVMRSTESPEQQQQPATRWGRRT